MKQWFTVDSTLNYMLDQLHQPDHLPDWTFLIICHPFIHLSIHLSIHPFLHPSILLHLHLHRIRGLFQEFLLHMTKMMFDGISKVLSQTESFLNPLDLSQVLVRQNGRNSVYHIQADQMDLFLLLLVQASLSALLPRLAARYCCTVEV